MNEEEKSMKNILMDCAVGTSLWALAEKNNLPKLPVWQYAVEQPEIVRELVLENYKAGAQIILTDTFAANRPSVKRKTNYSVEEIVKAAVKITKDALAGTEVPTALAIGPLTALLEPFGDMEEDECREYYEEMISAGMEAGAEMIYLQTFLDLEMMRIATEVAKKYPVPVFCTMTFEKVGKTMMGNSVEDVVNVLEPLGIDAIGMNCSLGPELAIPVIKEFTKYTKLPLIFKPNAGLPVTNEAGQQVSPYTPEMFVKEVTPALDFVTYIGGCCGTDPTYIAELKKVIKSE